MSSSSTSGRASAAEDDVGHALAKGVFDPLLLPDLPEAGPCNPAGFDDPLDLPEGVQIGAQHMGREETDVWVANVPADVAPPITSAACTRA